MATRIFKPRYPTERPCPADPVFDRAEVSHPTERVVEHEEEEFRCRFAHVACQDDLKALDWYENSKPTKVGDVFQHLQAPITVPALTSIEPTHIL
ncbi:hypothetical protein COMA2_110076 [Candidatus Nitrospira nitrificans]|uniref:Uncharacterized protein n=1 Tax=Candidatus Nitrospira nitrificans TaxID=1742973 RepID=A0A0S4L506_9BACT|nr:hypothetical protein COMA2_110076 [Candidatus Nitrospira nitrificans]